MGTSKKFFIVLFAVIILGSVTVFTLSAHLATMLSGEANETNAATNCYRQDGKIVCE